MRRTALFAAVVPLVAHEPYVVTPRTSASMGGYVFLLLFFLGSMYICYVQAKRRTATRRSPSSWDCS